MERNLATQVQARFTMRERYGTMLENERQLHEQAKQECDRDSVLATSLTRQARDERRVRVEGMERERSKIEETRREELLQGQQYVAKLQQLANELERDVETVRDRLMKNESDLNFVRQECFQEEREGIRLQQELEEEVFSTGRGRDPHAALRLRG